MDLPVVTPENYYSPEMNMAYMGSTQFKAFEKCEAAALAELRGEYTPPTSQAFLIGGYIDAWFSGELPLYQAQHPEIFKRDGTLKAEYVKAAEIVARLQADELYSMLMSGKKQVIRTGFTVAMVGSTFTLSVRVMLTAKQNYDDVETLLNRIVPENLILDLSLMYNQHQTLAAFTHAQLAAYTHYFLRNEVLPHGNN